MKSKGSAGAVNSSRLKGWAAIAKFLGQTPAVAQRWHNEGMPVNIEGRFVYAEPDWVRITR